MRRSPRAVLFNDSDPDGDPLSINLTSGPDPSLGSARLNNDGSIAFTAAPGASGTAMIGYEITDGEFTSNATLRITVFACAESVPVAGSATLTTGYQQPIAVNLQAYGTNGTITDVAGPPTYDGGDLHPAGRRERQRHDHLRRRERMPPAGERHDHDRRQPGPDHAAPVGRHRTWRGARGAGVRHRQRRRSAADRQQHRRAGVGRHRSGPTRHPTACRHAGRHRVVDDRRGRPRWPHRLGADHRDRQQPAADRRTRRGQGQRRIDAVVVSPLDNDSDPDGANDALALQSVPATITFPNGVTGTLTIVGTRQISIDAAGARGTDLVHLHRARRRRWRLGARDGDRDRPARRTRPPDAADQSVAAVVNRADRRRPRRERPRRRPVDGHGRSTPSGVVTGQAGLTLTITAPDAGTFLVTYTVSDGSATSRVATITITATDPPPPPTTTTTTVLLEPATSDAT